MAQPGFSGDRRDTALNLVVTDANGNVVGEQRYYPYGETRFTTGSMYTDKLFTGQREITGLGIYHYGARFYSQKLGRFLSADTVVPGVSNPQNLNRFSYVRNNPLRYIDPSGHRTCTAQEAAWGDETCYSNSGSDNHNCLFRTLLLQLHDRPIHSTICAMINFWRLQQ
jgi:RHS repeat-associated protein